ncbi:MAG TPA: potassium transporter Trk [Erysipelotrichaceae bacterium]|nr:TrkA family potassium uptake protein [Erysipelotrichaceae bacterium]HCY06979.1 potassium transporter Trk [Erysipelotrichaceae bacterium]
MKRKSFAVLGLGVFGSTIAKRLSSYDYDVIAIDSDMSCIDRLSDFVSIAIQADITDINQLKSAGVSDVDCAIVATGSHLENSIIAVMNLKELGTPYIVAKAKNKRYMKILEKIGADRVILPEKEMGERVAKQLVSSNIIDLIDIDDEYSVIEIVAPKYWINKSLIDLNLRSKYGINILGVRKSPSTRLSISPSANYIIEANDILLVIAEKNKFELLDIK